MKHCLTGVLLVLCLQSYAQHNTTSAVSEFRIMFYNVENLFDPFHDTLKNDHEFVGGGMKGWSWHRFETKINNIAKVIINAGGWQPPEIVALCEVENRFALAQMLSRTPLERFGYRTIHVESPDERGIDVALLYRPGSFREISHRAIEVSSAGSPLKTRDILYVKGLMVINGAVNNTDTLHLFVNHWPSRSGGIALSDSKRKVAALTLKAVADSLTTAQPGALIVITGDFNDEPSDASVCDHLGAKAKYTDPGPELVNMMTPYTITNKMIGTNKYKGKWGIIDQFIVSSNLISSNDSSVKASKAEILNFPFLLQPDEAYSGTIPFRTYNGMQYMGGFSDHLPILLTLDISD